MKLETFSNTVLVVKLKYSWWLCFISDRHILLEDYDSFPPSRFSSCILWSSFGFLVPLLFYPRKASFCAANSNDSKGDLSLILMCMRVKRYIQQCQLQLVSLSAFIYSYMIEKWQSRVAVAYQYASFYLLKMIYLFISSNKSVNGKTGRTHYT